MENVQRFQAFVKKYGLPEEEIFQTADLFEKRNIAQVTLSLYSLARLVSNTKIPVFFHYSHHSLCLIDKLYCIIFIFRLKSIPNGMGHRLDLKWQIRMNEHSPKSNWRLMQATWDCKWATIKVHHKPDMAAWEIQDTCKSYTNRTALTLPPPPQYFAPSFWSPMTICHQTSFFSIKIWTVQYQCLF